MIRPGSDLTGPNPKRQCVKAPDPDVTFHLLPYDVILNNMLICVPPKDILSFKLTCTTYYKICSDERFWHYVFTSIFKGVSCFERAQSWQEECLQQCRFIYNLLHGNFTSQVTPLAGVRTSTFAVAADGRLIIGDMDGQIKILKDTKTNEWELLGESAGLEQIATVLSENNLCVAVDALGRMMAWNLQTYEKILIPHGKGGFSLENWERNKTALVNGWLLRCTQGSKVIEMANLEAIDKGVLSFVFDQPISCMTSYNGRLYCGKWDESIEKCDVLTTERTTYAKKTNQEHKPLPPSTTVNPLQRIAVIDENRCFSLAYIGLEKAVICHNLTSHSRAVSSLIPEFCLGLEEKLECQRKNDQVFSLGDLSFVLQAFPVTLFALRTDVKPLFKHINGPIHNRGRIYSLVFQNNSENQAIFCADFLAPDKEIFSELNDMLGSKDPLTQERAKRRLKGMPQNNTP